jgi:hypothetical protein
MLVHLKPLYATSYHYIKIWGECQDADEKIINFLGRLERIVNLAQFNETLDFHNRFKVLLEVFVLIACNITTKNRVRLLLFCY